jgi:hypothetical protein
MSEIDLTLVEQLRSACLTYTALCLVHTASSEPLSAEEEAEMREAMAMVAYAGHAVIERARAIKAQSN